MRGTTLEQDSRFSDKSKKMLDNSVWPQKYDIKIQLQKVDVELIKSWIEKRVFKLLGVEDDIVSGTVNSLLDGYIERDEKPSAKKMHVDLSGFLKDKTLIFISELWDILDDAQKSKNGIVIYFFTLSNLQPSCLIQQKKLQEELESKRLSEIRNRNSRYNNKKFENFIGRHTHNYRESRRNEQLERPYQKAIKQTDENDPYADRQFKHKRENQRHQRDRKRSRQRQRDRSRERRKKKHERSRSHSRGHKRNYSPRSNRDRSDSISRNSRYPKNRHQQQDRQYDSRQNLREADRSKSRRYRDREDSERSRHRHHKHKKSHKRKHRRYSSVSSSSRSSSASSSQMSKIVPSDKKFQKEIQKINEEQIKMSSIDENQRVKMSHKQDRGQIFRKAKQEQQQSGFLQKKTKKEGKKDHKMEVSSSGSSSSSQDSSSDDSSSAVITSEEESSSEQII